MTDFEKVRDNARKMTTELSARLSVEFDDDIAAQLAMLQVAPFEEDAIPLELAEAVLKRNPRHGLANLVRAYLALHYVMDAEDLRRTATNLGVLIEDGNQVAAAALLLASIRRDIDLSVKFADVIDLIRASISANPGWTSNHLQLAWAMREAGRLDQARAEYDRAIANRLPDTADLSPLEWSYAACFTGQLSRPGYLEEERDALGRG